MKKYVLFGAGISGLATVYYIGKEKITAIIDNNLNLIGSFFEGIPVISFEDYICKYRNLQIVISIRSKHYYEVINQLKENKVWDYFTIPPVLYGFYTPEQMVKEFIYGKYLDIALYGINPITDRIVEFLEKNKGAVNNICFVKNERYVKIEDTYRGYNVFNLDMLPKDRTLIIATSPVEDKIRKIVKDKGIDNILDLYDKNKSLMDWKHKELKKFKNIHDGKRCFVIGNGPSLQAKDLEVLKGSNEITFAANGIYHIYNETDWRPAYYMIVDITAYREWIKDGMKGNLESCFISDYYYADVIRVENVNHFQSLSHIEEDALGFSEDITNGIYTGRTVTYAMLQLACYMGVKEIYLLGVDWTGGKGTGKVRCDFYNKNSVMGRPFDMFLEEEKSFVFAKKYTEEKGIKIYNATRGGELEVFERVDFDTLF